LVKTPISNPATIVDITKAVQREWDITRTGTASSTTLAFKPDAAALTPSNTPPAAIGRVGHWNGASWDLSSSSYSAGTWTQSGYTGTFSPFIVAAPDVALAVELKKVTAYGKGKNNIIEWSTANEKNMKEYIVERSKDGINAWEAISKQAAVNKEDAKYNVEDATASTLSFYRVKSVEFGGKEDISKVVSVKRETKGKLNINRIYPMPLADVASIEFETTTAGKVQTTVTDIVGRIVSIQNVSTVEGLNRLELNLNGLAQGSYILMIKENDAFVTQRIVKQ
jgi:Secretion system C-terminal sorting domain